MLVSALCAVAAFANDTVTYSRDTTNVYGNDLFVPWYDNGEPHIVLQTGDREVVALSVDRQGVTEQVLSTHWPSQLERGASVAADFGPGPPDTILAKQAVDLVDVLGETALVEREGVVAVLGDVDGNGTWRPRPGSPIGAAPSCPASPTTSPSCARCPTKTATAETSW